MIVTLAGHVDHGKTALVRALTGVDTDRLAEEKRRGLTIDLGFAYADIGGRRVGFVDVPGHHRFIHNMVAGIAGRQYALLVVAADDGVMPQSREHLQILRLLGLTSGVVALNKVDRVEPARIEEVRRDIRRLVAGTFLEGAHVLALSCLSGVGVETLRDHLADAARAHVRVGHQAPFRLAIDRAFTVRGSGLVVTGTVVAGVAVRDDELLLAASGRAVRVRGLHVQDTAAEATSAGDRAAVNLAGVRHADVDRGDWLLAPEAHFPTSEFAATVTVLDDFPRPLRHNAPVHIYHATSHCQGRILLLDSAPVPPHGSAAVDVLSSKPLHVKVGDRVIFRDQDLGRTLGGGRVLGLEIPSRRRHPARRLGLGVVDPDDPRGTLEELAKLAPVATGVFASHWNLRSDEVRGMAQSAQLADLDGHLLHADLARSAEGDVRAVLEEHHQANPDSPGLPEERICTGDATTALARRCVLRALVDADAVRVAGGLYAFASHEAGVPEEARRLFEAVQTLLDTVQPPSVGDIAKRLRRPAHVLGREMLMLPAYGLAEHVSDNRYYLPERLAELAAIAERLDAGGPFTVREFRDASGVGRNVVIEVLEHFDGCGFTQRRGDERRVVGEWPPQKTRQ